MRVALLALLVTLTGCSLVPEVAHQPVVHNPFPQLTKVAVAPFFNLSAEPTVDGRQFAMAYFNELQSVPGFEVVPPTVVERAMLDHRLGLSSAAEARKLAQILEVDAVVVGAVSDYSPYYPPRCTLQVEWYAANPCFHAIPPGYGLPWGSKEEEYIPAPLVFEAEMALARAQMKTQTPEYQREKVEPPTGEDLVPQDALPEEEPDEPSARRRGRARLAQHASASSDKTAPSGTTGETGAHDAPPDWPDARAFVPDPPCAARGECEPSSEPVLRHTKAYNGNDSEFTEALSSYYFFRDDARFGGWQSYLQRSDDFIRFCCHMHIHELLSARGGAGQTRVVWRWPVVR